MVRFRGARSRLGSTIDVHHKAQTSDDGYISKQKPLHREYRGLLYRWLRGQAFYVGQDDALRSPLKMKSSRLG